MAATANATGATTIPRVNKTALTEYVIDEVPIIASMGSGRDIAAVTHDRITTTIATIPTVRATSTINSLLYNNAPRGGSQAHAFRFGLLDFLVSLHGHGLPRLVLEGLQKYLLFR